jgi:hypothetical protein
MPMFLSIFIFGDLGHFSAKKYSYLINSALYAWLCTSKFHGTIFSFCFLPIYTYYVARCELQTRWPDLARFRKLGDCLGTFGSFLLLQNYISNYLLFFHGYNYALIWKRMDWATFCAIFFTNSSGHPVYSNLVCYIQYIYSTIT